MEGMGQVGVYKADEGKESDEKRKEVEDVNKGLAFLVIRCSSRDPIFHSQSEGIFRLSPLERVENCCVEEVCVRIL